MKILHIIDYFQPQIGYQESHLARIQSEKGHEVRVISSNLYLHLYNNLSSSESIFDSNKKKYETGINIEEGIETLRLPTSGPILFNKPWIKDLEKSILDFNPDVIHIHGIISFTSLRVAKLKGKLKKSTKLILDEHTTYDGISGSLASLFLYKVFKTFFIKLIKKNADKFVAVHEETKLFMSKMYGLELKDIEIIPLGCDTKNFKHDEYMMKRYREKFNIKSDEIVFCYVGKIVESKGVHIFINAAIDLINNGEKIKVLCVGSYDEKYLKKIKSKIHRHRLEEYFIFLKAVPNKDLYKFYSVGNVGIWPKECSLTILEAISCGLPVIVSNKTGAPERVVENFTGFFYEEENLEDLKDKMIIYLNPKILKKMSINSKKWIKKFDWEIISKDFEELYKS